MDKELFVQEAEAAIFCSRSHEEKLKLLDLICKKYGANRFQKAVAITNLNRYTAIKEVRVISESCQDLDTKITKVSEILDSYKIAERSDIMATFCYAEGNSL